MKCLKALRFGEELDRSISMSVGATLAYEYLL
jgi:hypothetical protein